MSQLRSRFIFIKNCKDCIYFAKAVIREESICHKFGKKDLPEFYKARECRLNEAKCGVEAKYFMSNLIK